MKQMKRLSALLLCAVLLLCAASCAGGVPDITEEAPTTSAEETAVDIADGTETSSAVPETETAETETAEAPLSEETSGTTEGTTSEPTTETTAEAPSADKADGIRFDSVSEAMSNMTLEEKVGQLFVITPEALYDSTQDQRLTVVGYDYADSVSDAMRENYRRYPAGGFILFGGNIGTGEQLKRFTASLHELGRIRPCLYIDEEGGTVARIGNSDSISVRTFGNMQSIAGTGEPANAYEVGSVIGAYLNEYGFDADFAPVADVNTNPDNPVIGKRAFGSDPALAGQMVAAMLGGLHSQGVRGCIKHFPGHGDTNTDSHTGYAETLKPWDEIRECEMLPFIAGIEAGTDIVMVAHISAPNVTGDSTPATLSYTLITEKLRGELGYNGVVCTDSMLMAAVSDRYSPAEAALTAFQAGVDIILMPDNYAQAFNGILNAVKNGEISVERLNASVERILRMKLS